ncbi:Chromosome partitioning protein ParB [Methylocella tundrae]|uniref:Chromosome partitioning protein ParB n=1 Tax=Methylocella tundrae TaxID=227605 RepID=A0A8B6MBY2_METTU|nr:ParB/RepB/Spo0J family partition protein [Methylocella tundrae]VTZ52510.1 Chromosome partitioning protein ParB [Methylocella tundrae]
MRPIEAMKGNVTPPEHFGPVPELRWLPIAQLVVDETYQREISGPGKTNVRGIAANFSWMKFAPVVVCPVQGGAYAIVDGQHRTTAALTIGIDSVPCLIIQADRKQQAESFRAINAGTVKVNRLAIYRASRAAGDPEALAIDAASRAAGVTIVASYMASKDLKPGETMASGTVGKCLAQYGRDLTVLALKTIVASESEQGGALQAKIIASVAAVLYDNPAWREDARLTGAFKNIDLAGEMEEAFFKAKKPGAAKAADLLYCAIVRHLDAALRRKAIA